MFLSLIVSVLKQNSLSFQRCRERTLSLSEKIWNSFLCLQSSKYLLDLPLDIGIRVAKMSSLVAL